MHLNLALLTVLTFYTHKTIDLTVACEANNLFVLVKAQLSFICGVVVTTSRNLHLSKNIAQSTILSSVVGT